jgi:hypothetical protein
VEPCNTTGHSKDCQSIAARVSQQHTTDFHCKTWFRPTTSGKCRVFW